MIVSASRRTDIPAFYSDWFFNRIKEGYVLARNPMNFRQVSLIDLSPEAVECIVFWTKNPGPMLNRLSELDGKYAFYFQFTLNPYDETIEKNVPDKKQLIETFRALSGLIGKDRVVWRYDPILLTDRFNAEYHKERFEYLAERLCGYTDKCVISFIDLYRKTERNMRGLKLMPMDEPAMGEIAGCISSIATKYNIVVESCCENIDLGKFGIKHGSCIDGELISRLTGEKLGYRKDSNQRPGCGCMKSVDIGVYDTCRHGCVYCYANCSSKVVGRNTALYDVKSPLLCGELDDGDRVYVRHAFRGANI